MSEILKNIETCRGEDVLAEVSAAPQDPHFCSLVNEAFDPMQQQALHQAGYDGYSEVIAQHKPYTFASAIIQMKSNLLLLLRALWQFPFGSGTLRSLADMWQHYITRLQGNETYGIPSRLSSLTDLPSAPLLLADRKISGESTIPDGISVYNLLCNTAANNLVTEINDTNRGWIWNRSKTLADILALFPSATKATLGCGQAIGTMLSGTFTLEELVLRDMTYLEGSFNYYNANGVIKAPELVELNLRQGYGQCFPMCREIIFPKCRKMYGYNRMWQGSLEPLQKLVLGSMDGWNMGTWNWAEATADNLLHLEFGADGLGGLSISMNLSWWTAANVISHQDFLPNFRTYIALRLADNGSGLTLTLSQAVYDAIKDESHLFVFDEGTMTIYAYLTNIKHWTVTK